MSLVLWFHPLASYCHKVLIALYDAEITFETRFLDLSDAAVRAELEALAPMSKMPVLVDRRRDRVVVESSIIIEYLAMHEPGAARLLPGDREAALEVRAQDRFFDVYVHEKMQSIVGDRLRKPEERDAYGVAQAHAALRKAYAVIDARMATREWAAGDGFGMADCAAAPALFYANEVEPFGAGYPNVAAYFARLRARPSYARVLAEAEPWMSSFPR